jgi:plasmid stabilization system protein ParE
MAEERKIIWDTVAKSSYKKFLIHIRSDSYQNAISVHEDIGTLLGRLIKHPESHPPDKYRIDNDGSFRAFEKHKLRISYRVMSDSIRIIRARSVRQEPLNY